MPQDIAAFLASYGTAFNRLDAAGIADHFDVPSLLVEQACVAWTSRQQIIDNMMKLVAAYRDGGFVRARFEIAHLLLQGADNAIADLLWTVERQGGAPPWRFRTGYGLHRRDGRWRIVLCTAYEERQARDS